MKRYIFLLLLLLFMLIPVLSFAEYAVDLTDRCDLIFKGGKQEHLTDRNQDSACTLPEARNHYITVIPGNTPVSALYLVMGTHSMPFVVQAKNDSGDWENVTDWRAEGHLQEYVAFPPQEQMFRLWFHRKDNEPTVLDLRELYLLSAGEVNQNQIHNWDYEPQKTDLMVIVAHPDDELLWFGGMIPYYKAERGLNVQVCYITCESAKRHLELLDGLWECGVRNYPAISKIPDYYSLSRGEVLKSWGEGRTVRTIVSWLRLYKPDVVVTHDIKGEYGHGAHQATSWAVETALKQASLPEYDGGSSALGIHQVKKLYRHLGTDPTLQIDWDMQIPSLGGRTGYEVAEDAYELHRSQAAKGKYAVAHAGDKNDSTLYTLVFSTVGSDEEGNDLFEHIDGE